MKPVEDRLTENTVILRIINLTNWYIADFRFYTYLFLCVTKMTIKNFKWKKDKMCTAQFINLFVTCTNKLLARQRNGEGNV